MAEPKLTPEQQIARQAAPDIKNMIVITDPVKQKAELRSALENEICEKGSGACTAAESKKVTANETFAAKRKFTDFPTHQNGGTCIVIAYGLSSQESAKEPLAQGTIYNLPKGFFDASSKARFEMTKRFLIWHEADHCQHADIAESN